ncbi:hypothetical protein [Glycomyces paridis]|uniref:Uncharacterized protein n=1 Tax=Glycomyces paridis TaxID=2126555 RepID=A0A4S8P4R4_9ACTN|nr:hypothetical protein [Glycomyces paridis]THV24355.1 hypothetical protein E9998_21250 [Glycomyces paridis]
MTLRFIDRLPVIGTGVVDEHELCFAWVWHQPSLRVTFAAAERPLLGQVTHLDGLARLVPAADNLAWLRQDDPARTRAVLDHAITLWRRKEQLFRDCDG